VRSRIAVHIDAATDEDVPRLCELLGHLFDQEADFRPDRDRQAAGLRLILSDPARGTILVAREARRVVGMVSLLFTISTAEGGPVALLEDMVVEPERRRAGIGRALLDAAIDHARAAGLARITLLTDRANEAALRFYGREGFEPSAMTPMRLKL
jgi:GNAT superfamily N-acetyltransferase